MTEPQSESQLQALAERAFGLFDSDPEHFPDKVEFNRSGESDVNIRGIWTFEERTEFIHLRLHQGFQRGRDENAIQPESSGRAE